MNIRVTAINRHSLVLNNKTIKQIYLSLYSLKRK